VKHRRIIHQSGRGGAGKQSKSVAIAIAIFYRRRAKLLPMKHIRYLLIAMACLASSAASAQWQWVDKDGRKVFSDRAPPADVPEKSILKRPGAKDPSANLAAGTAGQVNAAASAPGAAAPQISGVDKELMEKKKKAEEAEAAKRKAEKERVQIAKVENCARAKQIKANLSSTTRLFQMNDKGERVMVDDATRGAELKRAQSVIDTDC
jgi:hypothetical protein